MQLFVLFLTTLFLAMVLVAGLIKLSAPLGLVDVPDARKVHASTIPRVGGIGMVVATIVALLLEFELDAQFRECLLGVGILTVFGLLDDRYDLNYKIKFLGQFLAVLVVVVFGDIVIRRLCFQDCGTLPDAVAYPLTVFFLLGVTNAMNLADGLDGLAAGISILSLACIAFLADLAEGYQMVGAAVAIVGAILGFLRYNTHPAIVFMGDTGSQFLGFSAGVLAVLLTQKVNTALSGSLPLLILGLPIIDTLLVMGHRILRGVSPFKPDRNHVHHKLLSLGFDHYEAVLATYVFQALCILLAYFLRYESDLLIMAVYLALFALIAVFFPLANAFHWRLRNADLDRVSFLTRKLNLVLERAWLDKGAYQIVRFAVPLFLVITAMTTRMEDPDEIAVFAAGVLVSWVVWVGARLPGAGFVERVAVYSSVIMVVYLAQTAGFEHSEAARWFNYLIIVLAVVVGVGVRFSGRYFSLTPSDFLVMFVLLAAANLPVFNQINYAKIAAQSAILMYGIEYILRRGNGTVWAVRSGGILALIALARWLVV
ncbi:MraY family glycosyltransferase [Methylocaldum szegediense]|uniref:MraY family glycosyltransferase n=1 Tax=Methylocaldum szegediense TaxID=73780 RepID=UPI00042324A0|nr:hypothetical protein [Methylocaldum szegediense]